MVRLACIICHSAYIENQVETLDPPYSSNGSWFVGRLRWQDTLCDGEQCFVVYLIPEGNPVHPTTEPTCMVAQKCHLKWFNRGNPNEGHLVGTGSPLGKQCPVSFGYKSASIFWLSFMPSMETMITLFCSKYSNRMLHFLGFALFSSSGISRMTARGWGENC